jgi:hypothetical protein
MEHEREFIERLDKLIHEMNLLKVSLILQAQPDQRKADKAWRDLMKASEEVSSLWSGYSALEEIRAQREN